MNTAPLFTIAPTAVPRIMASPWFRTVDCATASARIVWNPPRLTTVKSACPPLGKVRSATRGHGFGAAPEQGGQVGFAARRHDQRSAALYSGGLRPAAGGHGFDAEAADDGERDAAREHVKPSAGADLGAE